MHIRIYEVLNVFRRVWSIVSTTHGNVGPLRYARSAECADDNHHCSRHANV